MPGDVDQDRSSPAQDVQAPSAPRDAESGVGPAPQAGPQVPAQLSGRARAWYVRAAEQHNAGRPDRAAELLISALALEPSVGCLREALARAQYDAKQYLAARTTFTAMTAVDPTDHFALFGLGLVEMRLGAYGASARHLQRAVSLCPDDPRYRLALEHATVTLRQQEAATVGAAGPTPALRSS